MSENDDLAEALLEFEQEMEHLERPHPLDDLLARGNVFCWYRKERKQHPLSSVMEYLALVPNPMAVPEGIKSYLSPNFAIKGQYLWPNRGKPQEHHGSAEMMAKKEFYAKAEQELSGLLDTTYPDAHLAVYLYDEPDPPMVSVTHSASSLLGRRNPLHTPHSNYSAMGSVAFLLYRRKTPQELDGSLENAILIEVDPETQE